MNSADFDGIVVIQCAGTKRCDAGTLKQNDLSVKFVANPALATRELAGNEPNCIYARPDDRSATGTTWRNELLQYNEHYKLTGDNPLGLLRAWELYKDRTYRDLAETLGSERLYILSAGWGLISADFLVPDYDITFKSVKSKKWVKRGKRDPFADFLQVSEETKAPIVFFGGEDYVWQLCRLTCQFSCRQIVFYNSKYRPSATGYEFIKFTPEKCNKRTNWHYECAKAFVSGQLTI